MKILLVETSAVGKNNVTVHVRNAITIQKYLMQKHDCRLVWEESQIDQNEQFDIILFFSASFYFQHDAFSRLMDNQKKCSIGWLTNEFELFQNHFLKGRTEFIIANFDKGAVKKAHSYKNYLHVNLNTLIIRENPTILEKTRGLCYYGTFRKYRLPYFRKWLKEDVVLSSSKKNWDKFASAGCDCYATTPFEWEEGKEQLARFKGSLYIEDTKTHKYFNHFANRFYEALNCNVLPIFDKTCIGTINLESKYFINRNLICEPESYKYTLEKGIDEEKDFFAYNRQVALNQKNEVLIAIDNFLFQECSLKN